MIEIEVYIEGKWYDTVSYFQDDYDAITIGSITIIEGENFEVASKEEDKIYLNEIN